MEINPLTGPPLPPGHVRLAGAETGIQFAGSLVATSSSDGGARPNKTKWTELKLFVKDDGQYVLHVIARSVVYHSMNGCDNGVQVRLGDLATRYLDAACTEPIPEPCTICRPPDIDYRLRDSNIMVMAEVDWHTNYVCRDTTELLKNLRQTKGERAGHFGMPALILLDRARQVDPNIAAALNQVQEI